VKPKKSKATPPPKNMALYRMMLTAKIGKDASVGQGIPAGVNQQAWIQFQQFCFFEDLAKYLEELDSRTELTNLKT
jgi:hypothetical protein